MNTNRHLHSPTKLTEFARNFDDEPETIFTKIVNKFTNAYNTSYNSFNEVQSSSSPNLPTTSVASIDDPISRTSSTSSINSPSPSATNANESPTSTNSAIEEVQENAEKYDEFPIESSEGRTVYNVLKRISSIVASKNNNLRSYKETELRRLWMPDSKAKECYDCSQKFSTFRRKHHCRLCGQIFCSKCCSHIVPGKIIKCSGDLKVCTYCSKIVLSYLKSPDITIDLKADLQAFQEDLTCKLSRNEEENENIAPRISTISRKISVGYEEESFAGNYETSLSDADRKTILQHSQSLKTLQDEMIRVLPIQNCGVDLIAYLNKNQKSSTKPQAVAILNAMLEAGFVVPLVPDSEEEEFEEHLHYKLIRQNDITTRSGNIQLDVNYAENSVHMSRSLTNDDTISDLDENESLFSRPFDELILSQVSNETEMENTDNMQKLLKSYFAHEKLLLSQMLRNLHLDQSWSKVLIHLAALISNHFRPSSDSMDIRSYINFKKVPGGLRKDSALFGGVVFSKNVAHKEMATYIDKPQILLLQCPIVYERVEGKFVSIQTLLLQEKEYLRNVTKRILNLKPNVVVVHKNVAGIAQDMLRSAGITLVLDVKMSVMERLARSLQCELVTSIESKFRPIKLGKCERFRIESFDDENGSSKTLMFFELGSSVKCGCCLLRGANNTDLQKVKTIASLLVYARYNWRLEMAFLLDEFATPPTPKPLIFDSKEQSPSDDDSNGNLKESESDKSPAVSYVSTNSIYRYSSENCEPHLQRKHAERKSEEKFCTIENVNDFSDPLRAAVTSTDAIPTTNLNDSNGQEISAVEFEVQTPFDNRFRTALSSTIISISPFVSFPLPYLETEQGRKSKLRSLFPIELYYSKQWSNTHNGSDKHNHNQIELTKIENERKLNPPHPFVQMQITEPIDNRDIQTVLAEFRAFGGRYPKSHTMSMMVKQKTLASCVQKKIDENLNQDALDLINHQRLPVLFCSFYYNPKGTSSCCTHPTLLYMKFYGEKDIMLGQFLYRYCFRSSYICQSCNLPMMDHVRRYVHSTGCVQVSLSEDINKNNSDKIFLTSVCSICSNVITPSVAISDDTKCLSFAKYLELRFHGHAYKIRDTSQEILSDSSSGSFKCPHSLHRDYIQYFSYKGTIAKFTYSTIEIREISLPPLIVVLKKPKPFPNDQVIEDIKKFSVQGHEVYSKIYEKIAELATEEESELLNGLKVMVNHDQFVFRQQVEIVQTLLIEEVVNSYDLNDAMIMAKKALAESIEVLTPKLQDAITTVKNSQKHESSAQIEQSQICTEDFKTLESELTNEMKSNSEQIQSDETLKNNENQTETEPHSPPPIQKRESKTFKQNSEHFAEKKNFKKIFSQIMQTVEHVNLIQSPFTVNEHLTLALGAFPILVSDQDFSSLIAYSLTINDYKKAIETLSSSVSGHCCDGNNSPNTKSKTNDGINSVEPDEKDTPVTTDEKKNAKPNSHIEINFQDATTLFSCKIYFAREFDAMRATILKPAKLEKSIYKELEQETNKKKEEYRLTQKITIIEKSKDQENISQSANQNKMDETRISLARSLCRSAQWEARGGKSGSKFSKTLDDRFVLKEMTQKEVTLFENFAPNYFEYIEKCIQQNQPTLLAKIMGVFRVSTKKKDSMHEKFLLVMENLFYDCDIKKKFDLKGSERNRLVNPTNQSGETVLLDENLTQMAWSNPLYILSHSKTILREAINRDASFLEKNDVMDYSLLVGLDDRNSFLVLGIIDYVRTFTFDKKLESIVKQSGILGGQGKLPTVISPNRYKQRFIEAMDRYFLSVPDRWEGLSKI